MRIRTIKPEFWESESLSRVSREARLLFVGLFSCCDDHGRTRAHSRILASRLYPFDEDALSLLEGWLSELESIGCIRRYMVDGETFLEIPKWLNHQKIDKPSKSKLPEYVPDSFTPREDSRAFAKNSLGTGNREQGIGTGNREQGMEQGIEGKGVKGETTIAPKKQKSPLTPEEIISKFSKDPTYTGIDVRREFGKMTAWCQTRRKVASERRFVNWLNNAERPLGAPRNGIPAAGVNHVLINAENWEKQEAHAAKVREERERTARMSAELDRKMRELEEQP